MHALANLYAAQKRIDEAEELYTQSINILKSRLGVSHPDVEALVKDYSNFQNESEGKDAKTSWGTFIALGLLSTAVFALKQLKN